MCEFIGNMTFCNLWKRVKTVCQNICFPSIMENQIFISVNYFYVAPFFFFLGIGLP
jgi:hypothetical protein